MPSSQACPGYGFIVEIEPSTNWVLPPKVALNKTLMESHRCEAV